MAAMVFFPKFLCMQHLGKFCNMDNYKTKNNLELPMIFLLSGG